MYRITYKQMTTPIILYCGREPSQNQGVAPFQDFLDLDFLGLDFLDLDFLGLDFLDLDFRASSRRHHWPTPRLAKDNSKNWLRMIAF
jgi:hypothetical protein